MTTEEIILEAENVFVDEIRFVINSEEISDKIKLILIEKLCKDAKCCQISAIEDGTTKAFDLLREHRGNVLERQQERESKTRMNDYINYMKSKGFLPTNLFKNNE